MKNLKLNFVFLVLFLFGGKTLIAQFYPPVATSITTSEFHMTILQYTDLADPNLAHLDIEVTIIGSRLGWRVAKMADDWGNNVIQCAGSCAFTWSYLKTNVEQQLEIICTGIAGAAGIDPILLDSCIVVIEPCDNC